MDFESKVKKIESKYVYWLRSNKCELISEKRALPTAIIAAQLFDVSDLGAMAFGCSTLWLFGVDRWFDERNITKNDLVVITKPIFDYLFTGSLCQSHNKESDELVRTIRDLDSLLSKDSRSFSQMRNFWISALWDTLYSGMLFEHQNTADKISFDRYLFHSAESIGVKFVNWSSFAAIIDQLHPSDYSTISRAQQLSAEIIRLLNDCVTYEKELKEGKKNSLMIIGKNKRDGLAKVIKIISEKHGELLNLCDNTVAHPFFPYVKGLVHATIRFYEESDFYDGASFLKQKYFKKGRNIIR